jgi:hypothetical protein
VAVKRLVFLVALAALGAVSCGTVARSISVPRSLIVRRSAAPSHRFGPERVSAIPSQTARVQQDPPKPDADGVARVVGRLIAGGDAGLVPSYIHSIRSESGCSAIVSATSVSAGERGRAMLARRRSKLVAEWRSATSLTDVGNAMIPLPARYESAAPAEGRVVQTGWVAVVVGMNCPQAGEIAGPIHP